MPLIKKPMNGMKDILPEEMRIRDYCIGVIKDTYASFGFSPIDTPSVEHIENLTGKQGGDNEKLIFRILKRGEKLRIDEARSEEDLVGGGLRYDLTVPLVRYYCANENALPSPFKALQIGWVWRADRPQRGRFRQFTQCDIDILGDDSSMAEIELIVATAQALGKLGFRDFQIRLSDRRILNAMAAYAGFLESEQGSVFITLDKMDKIGLDGVKDELISNNGYEREKVEKFLSLFGTGHDEAALLPENQLERLADILKDHLGPGVLSRLLEILEAATHLKDDGYEIVFDPTLVRGMSYYTGTVFEVATAKLGGSLGGGGRYDKLVGAFTGKDVPGVGFSLGFERIILLLMESGFTVPANAARKAYLIDKDIPMPRLLEIMEAAKSERAAGKRVLVTRLKKNKKFQKEQLSLDGYDEITEVYP